MFPYTITVKHVLSIKCTMCSLYMWNKNLTLVRFASRVEECVSTLLKKRRYFHLKRFRSVLGIMIHMPFLVFSYGKLLNAITSTMYVYSEK